MRVQGVHGANLPLTCCLWRMQDNQVVSTASEPITYMDRQFVTASSQSRHVRQPPASVLVDMNPCRAKQLKHAPDLGGGKRRCHFALDVYDHVPKGKDSYRVAFKRIAKRLVLFPWSPISDNPGHSQYIGKAVSTCCFTHGCQERFRPFGNRKFSERLPCISTAPDLVVFDCVKFG